MLNHDCIFNKTTASEVYQAETEVLTLKYNSEFF